MWSNFAPPIPGSNRVNLLTVANMSEKTGRDLWESNTGAPDGWLRILYPARKLKQILYPAEFFGSIPHPPGCLLFTLFVLYISPIVRVLTKK